MTFTHINYPCDLCSRDFPNKKKLTRILASSASLACRFPDTSCIISWFLRIIIVLTLWSRTNRGHPTKQPCLDGYFDLWEGKLTHPAEHRQHGKPNFHGRQSWRSQKLEPGCTCTSAFSCRERLHASTAKEVKHKGSPLKVSPPHQWDLTHESGCRIRCMLCYLCDLALVKKKFVFATLCNHKK